MGFIARTVLGELIGNWKKHVPKGEPYELIFRDYGEGFNPEKTLRLEPGDTTIVHGRSISTANSAGLGLKGSIHRVGEKGEFILESRGKKVTYKKGIIKRYPSRIKKGTKITLRFKKAEDASE